MFSAARAAAISTIEWEPKRLEYVEAWVYEGVRTRPMSNDKKNQQFTISQPEGRPIQHEREGVILKDQCEDWLHHRGDFAVPSLVEESKTSLIGGLRLLLCDRTSLIPPGIGISQTAFEEAEKVLSLHKATLPSFLGEASHSRYLTKDDAGQLLKADLVLKVPQKYEIANYGLSVSFNVKTRWTTALMFGESVTETAWKSLGRHASNTPQEAKAWEYQSPKAQILKQIRGSSLPWNHPLLLPCSLLTDHSARMRAFCNGELTKDVMLIERELGVVKVGSRNEEGMSGLWPHWRAPDNQANWTNALLDRPKVMDGMTVKINMSLTRVLFTRLSPQWSLEASQFLLDFWANTLHLHVSKSADHFLTEALEYNQDVAASIQHHVDTLKSRMELQLDILYSFVAQKDNRLNTRIARSSGRDSVSMKILAFISAIFLPPSYIAALFAIQGIFNWAPSGGGDGGADLPVLSGKFWIYWVTALPLTFLTLVGWAIWWRVEMKRYPDDPEDNPPTPPGFVAQIMETLGWSAAQAAEADIASTQERRQREWVFGGRRRHSKLGIETSASDILDAEASAMRSPITSPKTAL